MTSTRFEDRHLDEALRQLVSEGTIDAEQATAVQRALASEPVVAEAHGLGTLAVLAASYVGVGLIAAAIATFLGQSWDDLSVAARSVVFGVLTAALVAAGVPLRGKFDQARGLAWLVAVVAAGGLGGALFSADGVDEATTALAVGGCALALALPLLRLRPAAPQVLAFVASVLVVVFAVAGRYDIEPELGGTLAWTVGMATAAAALTGLLPARPFTLALGGLIALFGTQAVGAESVLLETVLALLLAVPAYVLAVRTEPAVPLTIATLTVATTAPRVLGEWLHGTIGAPGVLAASGLIILAAVATHVGVVRRRGAERHR